MSSFCPNIFHNLESSGSSAAYDCLTLSYPSNPMLRTSINTSHSLVKTNCFSHTEYSLKFPPHSLSTTLHVLSHFFMSWSLGLNPMSLPLQAFFESAILCSFKFHRILSFHYFYLWYCFLHTPLSSWWYCKLKGRIYTVWANVPLNRDSGNEEWMNEWERGRGCIQWIQIKEYQKDTPTVTIFRRFGDWR